MARPHNLGLARQYTNTDTQSASLTSTGEGDDAESRASSDAFEVPAWIAAVDAVKLEPWSTTLSANRWQGRAGAWKVACILCGRPIGAGERPNAQGQQRQRLDTAHEHRARVKDDRARRIPCDGMLAAGASCKAGRQPRQPGMGYRYDGLERLALALVRRYPVLLDSKFQHDQIAEKSSLHGDLRCWLGKPDGQRLLAMRMQDPSVDLKPTIDRMAAALEV